MAPAKAKSTQQQKRQLALTLDASRTVLTASGSDLRRRLHPARATRNFVRQHPVGVFGATAALVAFFTYRFRTRSRRHHPERPKKTKSTLRRFLIWVISLCMPGLRLWILKHAKTYIQAKHVVAQTDSLLGP